jgi:hypothetical protein
MPAIHYAIEVHNMPNVQEIQYILELKYIKKCTPKNTIHTRTTVMQDIQYMKTILYKPRNIVMPDVKHLKEILYTSELK